MDDLTAFIEGRLDEDEGSAREALALWDDALEIIAFQRHYGPARALREVAAKRAVLALHHPEWGDYVDGDGDERATRECAECEPPGTPDNWPCPTIRALAAVWSDHPDYPLSGSRDAPEVPSGAADRTLSLVNTPRDQLIGN